MNIHFYKYQGTGNDFVIIDNIKHSYSINLFTESVIKKMCDRRFGIGADGLIILEESKEADFKMIYFNADDNQSSMCGNGGRCILHLAHQKEYIKGSSSFEAIDGIHRGISADNISVHLRDVQQIEKDGNNLILNTGSPHYVVFSENIAQIDIVKEAHKIRYNDRFKDEGINVNFVEKKHHQLHVRTYERGVEDETLSCGTGVTASAIAASVHWKLHQDTMEIITPGGELTVSFDHMDGKYQNIWLSGPVEQVYHGSYSIDNI